MDDRIDSPAPPDAPPIINIGQGMPTASSGLRHVDSLAVRHQSRSLLSTTQQVHMTLLKEIPGAPLWIDDNQFAD